jgi:hypothetical protein
MFNKYKYTELKNITDEGIFNFYGVVYDATFPALDKSSGHFLCALKLIDPDINLTKNFIQYLNILIKAPTREVLPHFHTVGDIVRIHRGKLVLHV